MSRYWSTSLRLKWGWVTLSTNFRDSGASPNNDCWQQKTRVPGLSSYSIVSVILRLAVLVQYKCVTDGRTHDDSLYRASIASRG